MRLRPLLACFAGVASLSSPALAESHAPALVRLLTAPGRPHPLADATGRIPLSVTLPPGASAAALGLLEVAPGVGALRLAPGDVAPFAAAHPDLALGVAPPLHPLLDVSGTWTHVSAFRAATGLTGQHVIVGVVDTGLDVRHPDFRTKDGHTRVAWLLAALPPTGRHPDLEARFGCTEPDQAPCAVYSAADIDALIASNSDELTDTEGHGTHVTSIAAGNGGPSVNAVPRFVGLAPEATLIVAAPPQNGGFYDTDILNAARFVFDRASAMGLPAGCSGAACVPTDCADANLACTPAPVAMNISLGSDYGAHDGSSNLEMGLSAMVGDDLPGRAIAVAAGNSGEIDYLDDGTGPLGIHTEVHVYEGETTRVPLLATTDTTNGTGFVWITFRPGDDVSVGLEGPGGSTWVGLTGQSDQGGYQKGDNQGGVVNNLPSANNTITAHTNSAVVTFSGNWANRSTFAVVLRGSGDASLWLTAQQGATQNLYFEKPLRQGTINVPASAPGLLAVGCTVNRVQWRPLTGGPVVLGALGMDMDPVPDSACYFSADGPTPFGVEKPEISAPGAFVAAAMSAAADPRQYPGGLFDIAGCPPGDTYCALLDNQHALSTGTSMSAPHATGAVALLLELDLQNNQGTPTLTQARVTEVLQAGARRSTGHVPDAQQLGPGSLDVEGARLALLDSTAAPANPDPHKSWYTLSSAYARPDPTWPVWGSVALRKSDGTPATGTDGTGLALALQGGGTVYQAITRIRPGLWRFAVAGLPADLGNTLSVDVTYGGVSLGVQTLPVGADVWTANDPTVSAVSACSLATGGGRRGVASLVLAALALAAGAARRSRWARPSRRQAAR